MPEQTPVSECLKCEKPLGAATQEQGIPFCHDCRKCTACGLPLGRLECAAVIAEWQELDNGTTEDPIQLLSGLIQHPRCSTLNRPNADKDPSVLVKQSYLDWLNNFRLLCEPTMELNELTNTKQAELACYPIVAKMSWEEQYMFLRRMEAGVAHMSIAVKTHAKTIKQTLDAREKVKFEQAAKDARISSRPVVKPADEVKEIILAQFMERQGIKERKQGQKLLKLRSEAIRGLMAVPGITEQIAQEMVDKQMRDRGDLK